MMLNLLKRQIVMKHSYFSQFSKYSKMDRTKIFNLLLPSIPPLDGTHHKGQAGRIGIVGGSLEYTGAPYFSGMAALKVGADLVHIFCTNSAATVIKSYSPELIVHPLLDKVDAIKEISPWLERLHVIVIGPGLGRDPKTFDVVSDLIKLISVKQIPLIIDADGLFLITENPDLIRNFTSPIILTPNKIEFERLSCKLNGLTGLQGFNKNVTLLRKGATDEFYCCNPDLEWKINEAGSGRRCGGQGDLLSGSIATFLHWTIASRENINVEIPVDKMLLATSLSCFAASLLIRKCNAKAFQVKGRSMLATDMVEYIHEAFTELYGQ
ncbi:ATP-dependent (S)-NAD(P)H-hydrate dehydratase isoform X1 [Vanessa cardui]|uniref:ATP-dependent (S)-NAD(P)H-hydrate dehydratase isoform X1 n=2 Tax=Vanessa cardui TaxID=171605 RepID=UPI001F13115B|nr:ATP-dependent (S)-NAD(P)H-hydrate dehydratase isoform X1 [Vanessa cardui]